MIKPLYFPDMSVNQAIVDALKNQFDSICVYGPATKNLQDECIAKNKAMGVETIFPFSCDEADFNEFLIKGLNQSPLNKKERASDLRTEIKTGVHQVKSDKDMAALEGRRLIRAGVFLKMAEDYDEQSRVIDEGLLAVKKKEQALMDALHGEVCDNETLNQQSDSYGSFNTEFQLEKRFEAWATLFYAALPDSGKTGSGLYLSDSRILIDNIIEFQPELEHVADMPVDADKKGLFSDFAERLITCDWEAEKEFFKCPDLINSGSGMISFYILPEKRPFEFFKKFTSDIKANAAWEKHMKKFRNTVIAFIEI